VTLTVRQTLATAGHLTGPAGDPSWFTAVMSRFASGITVLASTRDGRPVGMTCQSFFSLSVDPPMVAFSVARTSASYVTIRETGSLVVNVLSGAQGAVSAAMARSGTDKWAGVSWTPGEVTGHPVLDGALAHVECQIAAEYDGGDHVIVTADVLGCDHATHGEAAPLLYYRSRYHGLTEHTGA
jgi:flavin reductase (DIM6/NTAB) family NADH-FMN oxidoreductase RutF